MKKYVTTITVAVFFFTVGLFVSSAFARQDKMNELRNIYNAEILKSDLVMNNKLCKRVISITVEFKKQKIPLFDKY